MPRALRVMLSTAHGNPLVIGSNPISPIKPDAEAAFILPADVTGFDAPHAFGWECPAVQIMAVQTKAREHFLGHHRTLAACCYRTVTCHSRGRIRLY
jgi:hypothetical protein